jgi:hypothetical protein
MVANFPAGPYTSHIPEVESSDLDPVIWVPSWVFRELTLHSPAECQVSAFNAQSLLILFVFSGWYATSAAEIFMHVTYQRMSHDGSRNCCIVCTGLPTAIRTDLSPDMQTEVLRAGRTYRSADNRPTAYVQVFRVLTQFWKDKRCLEILITSYYKRVLLISCLLTTLHKPYSVEN